MTTWAVHRADDAVAALDAVGAFLRADPVGHNLVLSLLEERAAHPEPGRYWWATRSGAVEGVFFQSPLTFNAAITTMPVEAVAALVDGVGHDTPDLPGVFGEAAVAARFAGTWAEVLGAPAEPSEGQRLYRLDRLVPPAPVPGEARPATAADLDLLVPWLQAFQAETGVPTVTAEAVARRVEAGLVTVWDHDGPRATTTHTPPVAGVSRIAFVYTPPDQRGRGWGAACVAAASEHALAGGATRCVLYTQLANPTSNALYRRLGYTAVAEQLRYRFSPRTGTAGVRRSLHRAGDAVMPQNGAVHDRRPPTTPPTIPPDAEAATWLQEALVGFAADVGSLVPAGFEAHARVFHAARRGAPDAADLPMRWSDAAAATDSFAHGDAQLGPMLGVPRFAGSADRPDLWDDDPSIGSLPRAVGDRLLPHLCAATTTPDRCWLAVWEGWASMLAPLVLAAPTFELPQRRYHLVSGPPDLAVEDWAVNAPHEQSPSLWWPEDRSWVVATEIDLASTYVAGSAALVRELCHDSQLEAVPVAATDPVSGGAFG